jgi:dienelactone hydrolase
MSEQGRGRLRTDGRLGRVVLVAALLSGACVPRVHIPLTTAAEHARHRPVVALPAAFAGPRPAEPPAVTLRYRKRVLAYDVSSFSFPSSGSNRQPDNLVRGRYFHRAEGGRRGLVVVLPIWGRSKYPPAITTRRLIRRGELDVLVLQAERALIDWRAVAAAPTEEAYRAEVRRWVAVYTTTVEDVRRALDWGLARPEVDRQRVGLVGFSMSAIVGATVTGLDPRLTRAVFVMGSPRLEDIFLDCPMLPGRVRERLRARFGWSREDLRRRLAPELAPINPVTYAGRIDPRRVLMFDAARDRFVPRASRELLWESLGRPERITLAYGHGLSFLSFTVLDNYRSLKDITRFLHAPATELGPARVVAAASSSSW